MTTPSRAPDLIALAIAANDRLGADLAELIVIVEALDEAVSTLAQPALNTPLNAAESLAEHRRNHRPGHPAKIKSDPELKAFILARIDKMIFADIVCKVAENFPPDRRVSRSSVHRWWQKHRANLSP